MLFLFLRFFGPFQNMELIGELTLVNENVERDVKAPRPTAPNTVESIQPTENATLLVSLEQNERVNDMVSKSSKATETHEVSL